MSRAFPWLVLLFVSVMAGVAYVFIKYLVGYVAPVDLLMLQFVPVSIVSLVLIFLFYRATAGKVVRRYWWFFIVREALAVLGFQLALLYGESVLPAGIAAMIVGIWPVITVLIALPILGERLTARKLAGGLVAFAGAAAVVHLGARGEAAMHQVSPEQWIAYSLLLLLAAVSAALVTVMTRWFLSRSDESEEIDSFLFTLLARSPGGFFALIVYLLVPHSGFLVDRLAEAPTLFWVLLGVLVFYNSLIGFWLWNWTLQRLQAGNVASFTYVQTFFAVLVAWIFLAEGLSLLKILGVIAIVGGVFIANVEAGGFLPNRRGRAIIREPITPGH